MLTYETMGFEEAMAKLHEDYKNDKYSFMATKTWLGIFGSMIGFNPKTNWISVFDVDVLRNTVNYSSDYHLSLSDMDEPWYYFEDEATALKFLETEYKTLWVKD